ncbi:hypothetical protein [Streptomyces sp. Root369]|uniref:LGFP repeat-containing protein n=1 Tax=Streptomyces sp. Root369 TaxID=1736523 RepID=UPI0018FEC4A5|nr:hypothetical protein [Streptomyces sp. Root369]
MDPRIVAEQAIGEKNAALNGAPGEKVGELDSSGSVGGAPGFVQKFQNGAIYWRRDLGAWWVLGDIYQKYLAVGGAAGGVLGHPVSDETSTGDGVGRFNHFERGSIYWHPTIGAFEVHGEIHACWQRLGSEVFGYPVTDETATGEESAVGLERGKFNDFRQFLSDGSTQGTSIYWSMSTDAHAVSGSIKDRWVELGRERSYLGFPITDEMEWVDPDTQKAGRINHFERGAIAWAEGETTEFPERRIFRSGRIGTSSVGGWAELTVTSAGTFHFSGHLHNSGFFGSHCTVAMAVKVPQTNQAIAATHEGSVGGTTSFDSRDEDWNENGSNLNIRAYWELLRDQVSVTTKVDDQLGAQEVVEFILLPLVGAAVVLSLVAGPSGPDTQCTTTEGWHTVRDGNNNTVFEEDGVRCRKP